MKWKNEATENDGSDKRPRIDIYVIWHIKATPTQRDEGNG